MNGGKKKPSFSGIYFGVHGRLKAPANKKLSNEQFQAAIASTIGDGYLSKPNKDSEFARLCWNMGNKEHAQYKAKFFEDFGTIYRERENPGWGTNWFSVNTACHPCFNDILSICKPDGKNLKITAEIMSMMGAIGWAWFYGDDGSLAKANGGVFLHTEGYDLETNEIIANAVNEFVGLNCSTIKKYVGGTPKKERLYILLNGVGSDEFFKKIAPHMADGLEYKLPRNNINRRKRKAGSI